MQCTCLHLVGFDELYNTINFWYSVCLEFEGQNEIKVRRKRKWWYLGVWSRHFNQWMATEPITMKQEYFTMLIETFLSSKFWQVSRSLTMKRKWRDTVTCVVEVWRNIRSAQCSDRLIVRNNSGCVLDLVVPLRLSATFLRDTCNCEGIAQNDALDHVACLKVPLSPCCSTN